MNRRVSITTVKPEDFRNQVAFANRGGSVFYSVDGEDAAVLIPVEAFKAVQKLIGEFIDMPLTCWEEVLIPLVYKPGVESSQSNAAG